MYYLSVYFAYTMQKNIGIQNLFGHPIVFFFTGYAPKNCMLLKLFTEEKYVHARK